MESEFYRVFQDRTKALIQEGNLEELFQYLKKRFKRGGDASHKFDLICASFSDLTNDILADTISEEERKRERNKIQRNIQHLILHVPEDQLRDNLVVMILCRDEAGEKDLRNYFSRLSFSETLEFRHYLQWDPEMATADILLFDNSNLPSEKGWIKTDEGFEGKTRIDFMKACMAHTKAFILHYGEMVLLQGEARHRIYPNNFPISLGPRLREMIAFATEFRPDPDEQPAA